MYKYMNLSTTCSFFLIIKLLAFQPKKCTLFTERIKTGQHRLKNTCNSLLRINLSLVNPHPSLLTIKS